MAERRIPVAGALLLGTLVTTQEVPEARTAFSDQVLQGTVNTAGKTGADLYRETCAACHGADGNSAAADFPKLAGQHYDYLVKAMRDYKSGARKNAIMSPLVANLTQRDLEDLAAFYAHQSGLVTRKSSYFARH